MSEWPIYRLFGRKGLIKQNFVSLTVGLCAPRVNTGITDSAITDMEYKQTVSLST